MVSLSRFRPGFRRAAIENEAQSVAIAGAPASSNEKNPTTGIDDVFTPNNGQIDPASEDAEKDVLPTEDAQRGVQEVEAVTLTWTKPYLVSVFIL